MNNKKDYDNSEEAKRRRRIMIIILIILLLLLITSCSCTGRFWGKIGDWFVNHGDYVIDDDTHDLERIRNKELKFDVNNLEMSLSDNDVKLSFSYTKINPKDFTCKTSDANIATCYVKDGYVVINPKKPGKVTVTLETEANGKIYEATADVTITEASKYIVLSSTKGSINLAKTKTKYVGYTLVGIKGNVSVSTSDENVATATLKDGVIKITAKKPGTVKITLAVTDNGTKYTSTYTLTVINKNDDGSTTKPSTPVDKDVSENNYLSNIKSDTYPLNETFNKAKNDYTIDVDYNTNNIKITVTPESNKSDLKYKINGESIPNLDNVPLKEGDNKLEIIVTAENGDVNTYVINIHKPVRTIEFEHDSYNIAINGNLASVVYKVLEDNEETDNYNEKDIIVSIPNYNGKYTVNNGYITLDPDPSMAGKEVIMNVSYNGKIAKTKLVFEMSDYYLYSYPSAYVISLENGTGYKNLILNTNMFEENFKVINTENGIRLESNTGDIYIDITSSNDIIKLSVDDTKPSSSLVVKATASEEGTSTIKAVGYAYGKKINEVELFVTATNKALVTIDANGGFFNEFTSVYQFIVAEDEVINLSEYVPYKDEEAGNCKYFELINYNTATDGSGIEYTKDQVISNITKPLTLYAIYSDTSKEMDIKSEEYLYLTDVDLFHNEEYFKKYGEDKVIYPGAHGSYVMTITNNKVSDLEITGVTFEEDTICIPGQGCLNMGYKLRHAAPSELYKYYYGSSENYTILNKAGVNDIANNYTIHDVEFSNSISIPKGNSVEITLFWEWVSVDDDLDTAIGEQEINPNDEYTLTLRINFETNNKYCIKN